MKKSVLTISILSSLALCTSVTTENEAVQPLTIDDLAIRVSKDENREFSFTNKRSAYWYGRTHQDHFGEWFAGWNDSFHIYTHIRVCILIDAQTAARARLCRLACPRTCSLCLRRTRMFAEYIHDARLRQYGQLTHNLTGHQMETTRLRF